MALSNTASGYGSISRTLHWLTALFIFTALALGLYLEDQPTGTDAEVARVAALYSLHKTVGLAAFLTALIRILWGISQIRPGHIYPNRRIETFLGDLVHWLLYGALVIMPLSGWITHAATTGFAPILWPFGQSLPFVPKSPELAETFGRVHGFASKILIGALILHVAGALKHAIIDRDATLARMITGRGPLPAAPDHVKAPGIAAFTIWLAVVLAGLLITPPPRNAAPVPTTATAAPASAAANWTVETGTLGFVVKQMTAEVKGQFTGWTAAIAFDEATRTGNVDVTIPIAGMTVGSVTRQAAGPEFFDMAKFPTATFTGTIAETNGQLTATGPLTIHGIAAPISLPFTLTITGDTAQMSGQVTIDRRTFGIGANYKDETTVAFPVQIDVTLTAKRK